MTANQPQLPGLPPDFTQPIEVKGRDLATVLAEARAAGFEAIRMEVLNQSGYKVSFQRTPAPSEPPCGCDLCAALSAPSDLIEAALRHSANLEAKQSVTMATDSGQSGALEKSKESFFWPDQARLSCTPTNLYATKIQ